MSVWARILPGVLSKLALASKERKLVIPRSGKKEIYKINGSTQDAIDAMEAVIRAGKKSKNVREISLTLRNGSKSKVDFLQKLSNFAYKSAYFVPDPSDTQQIRTVDNVLKTGQANCVSYSVLISSILFHLKIPHSLRAIQQTGSVGFNHIYPVVDGIALDVVTTQDQDGKEFFTRPIGTYPTIGNESEYLNKLDTKIL